MERMKCEQAKEVAIGKKSITIQVLLKEEKGGNAISKRGIKDVRQTETQTCSSLSSDEWVDANTFHRRYTTLYFK